MAKLTGAVRILRYVATTLEGIDAIVSLDPQRFLRGAVKGAIGKKTGQVARTVIERLRR